MTKNPSTGAGFRCAIVMLILVAASLPVFAGTWTWDAGGTDNLWTTVANWNQNKIPDQKNPTLQFGTAGSARLTPEMNQAWTVGNITFSSGAPSYTLNGNNNLSLSVIVANQSVNTETINSPILLTKNVKFYAPSGDLVFNGTVDNQGHQLTVDGAFDVAINGVISGSGGLLKDGAGTLTLGGANSFTGPIQVNQGTLLLGGNDRIADSANLTLNSGALATGGYNETLGSLTLTANSYIDLGSGSSVLHFGNSAANTWTAGTKLVIDNWSGQPTGGGTDQVYFGSLTSSQVSEIYFQDPFGFGPGLYPARYLPSGELVPVPEPAMTTVLVFLGAALGFRERRNLRNALRKISQRLIAGN